MTPALAARLEAAPEGSRELSDAVLEAAGWERIDGTDETRPLWITKNQGAWYEGDQPHPTRDLNAIVEMVRPGQFFSIAGPYKDGRYEAELAAGSSSKCISAEAATPALALSAALVRALEK